MTAALGVAVSFLWTGRKLRHVQPAVTTLYMALSGLLIIIPFTIAGDAWALPQPDYVSWAILSGAVLTFAVAFLAMFSGVGMIGASRAAMIMNLEPIFTIALALLLLSETLGYLQLAGAALVISAIVVSQQVCRVKI